MGWRALTSSLQGRIIRRFRDAAEGNPAPGWTYTPSIGVPYSIDGVFRDAHVPVTMGAAELEVSAIGPMLSVRRSDLAADPVAQADQVTRASDGQVYEIIDTEPDGEGLVALILHEV